MNPDKRTDEELNRVIAEWCGWKFVPEHDVSFSTPAGHVMPEGWTDPEGEPYSIPPNYCRDLNACHEVEMQWRRDGESARAFDDALYEIHTSSKPKIWHWLSSNARQRAEALVKVIEQQKEQK